MVNFRVGVLLGVRTGYDSETIPGTLPLHELFDSAPGIGLRLQEVLSRARLRRVQQAGRFNPHR